MDILRLICKCRHTDFLWDDEKFGESATDKIAAIFVQLTQLTGVDLKSGYKRGRVMINATSPSSGTMEWDTIPGI